MRFRAIIGLCVSMLFLATGFGQSYPISNATVSDCNAGFTDSNAGASVTPSFYGHNEDFTFSICPAGADSIILSFSSFCTELNLDVITFYDGPNVSSPTIGIPYSGTVSIPPIIATSGCLTVHFQSDASVACTGWQASWVSIINTPDNPVFTPIANPLCNTNSLVLTLDQALLCSSVNAANFSIFGPSNQTVTNIAPIGCSGGSSNTIQVDFSPGLNSNGNYSVQFVSEFLDACDSLWTLTAFGNFAVNDCPISLDIESPDTQICTGTCTTLEAVAWGGSGNYAYTWNNGLPSSNGPHTVCPTITTTYTASVTDGTSAPAGTAQITVIVVPPVVLPANFTICQSDANVDLDATPNSGYWLGPCLGNDTLTGIFHPGWCGTGVKKIYYVNGECVDSMQITVTPMSVGATYQLVCPGSPSFNIWTNNPGGTFTGTGITNPALGTFDPVLAGPGVHNITYSNPPCANVTKIIRVGTATIQADDTICSNSNRFEPAFSPKGGTWTGPGVTNWYWCNFDPGIAGPGTHSLIYSYGNCSDTLLMTVIEIDAGNDLIVCPAELPFDLIGSPLGGQWSGQGITNPLLGTFNPGFNSGNNFDVYLTYSFNGCSDSLRIRGIQTVIGVNPLNSLCNYDNELTLNYTNTNRIPGGGFWSGAGITNPSANGTFSPSDAGPGTHTLYYSNNTCVDSTIVLVYPDPQLQDTSVCIVQSAFNIPSAVAGGTWVGNGIVNPTTGTFLASLAGIGNHYISYLTPDDCSYNLWINVDTLPILSLIGLPDIWCFADTNFTIINTPIGGVWSGASSDSIFNPIDVGSGVFTITYTLGSGQCAVSTSRSIQIRDTLKVTPFFVDTTICSGSYIRIGANAEGGDLLNYTFSWDQGLGNSSEIVFQADSTNTYTVSLNDACSYEATTSTTVSIYPNFDLEVDTSDKACFGLDGWIKISPIPAGSYSFSWQHDSTLNIDSIAGVAGQFYNVQVANDNTGCAKELSAIIPSFGQIVADFLSVPNDECVDLLNPEFYFIDQSIGGVNGILTFGDGSSLAYVPYENNYHLYQDTGRYEVVLQLTNDGGCFDQQILTVCVLPKTLILAPSAFSPNSDGVNDELIFRVIGANELHLSIYNRWGELMFETLDLEQHWDGNFKNAPQEIGTYSWQLQYLSVESKQRELSKGIIQLIR